MSELKNIYEKLIRARRPIDFFGSLTTEEELKKVFRDYARKTHPDTAPSAEKYIAEESFKLLNDMHVRAVEELTKGIYNVVNTLELYKTSAELFAVHVRGTDYKFYENLFDGEVADIYRGTDGKNIIYLKIAKDESDNELIETEFETLKKVIHQSLPIAREKIVINDRASIVMDEVVGTSMNDILLQYPDGVDPEHVMWMLERLFSVVGYLHFDLVVHQNIKPEHIIINKDNHNVSLVGFSFSIPEANQSTARYSVVNEYYSAPEISKTAKVTPSADIYSIGKIAIKLLGGDVSTNGMPIRVHEKIRTFIRKLVTTDVKTRPNDAWKLWDEVRKLRTEIYGNQRFKKFN